MNQNLAAQSAPRNRPLANVFFSPRNPLDRSRDPRDTNINASKQSLSARVNASHPALARGGRYPVSLHTAIQNAKCRRPVVSLFTRGKKKKRKKKKTTNPYGPTKAHSSRPNPSRERRTSRTIKMRISFLEKRRWNNFANVIPILLNRFVRFSFACARDFFFCDDRSLFASSFLDFSSKKNFSRPQKNARKSFRQKETLETLSSKKKKKERT